MSTTGSFNSTGFKPPETAEEISLAILLAVFLSPKALVMAASERYSNPAPN